MTTTRCEYCHSPACDGRCIMNVAQRPYRSATEGPGRARIRADRVAEAIMGVAAAALTALGILIGYLIWGGP